MVKRGTQAFWLSRWIRQSNWPNTCIWINSFIHELRGLLECLAYLCIFKWFFYPLSSQDPSASDSKDKGKYVIEGVIWLSACQKEKTVVGVSLWYSRLRIWCCHTLWLWLLLWHGFDLWPGNFCMPWAMAKTTTTTKPPQKNPWWKDSRIQSQEATLDSWFTALIWACTLIC